MRYFYTTRVVMMFYLAVSVTAVTVGLLARSWLLGLLVFLPASLANMFLATYRPPFKGERRSREVHYWQTIEWDGNQWVDVDD